MTLCAAIKQNGLRCRSRAMKGSEYCYGHAPGRSEQRRANASKGGRRGGRSRRSNSGGELADIKERLARLYEDLREGEVEPKVGAVAAQIANVQIRLLEMERRLAESEEFEQRVAELEARFSEADRISPSSWAS